MKITLAKSAGFCFGVKRAIAIAENAARSFGKVYMLGDIVHNRQVVKEMEKRGVKKIKNLGRGKEKVLIIRAHGTDRRTFSRAKASGYAIIDATCPMVKEIHKIAVKAETKGNKVIIIGDKKHAEVRGITGQLKKKALVINSLQNIPWDRINGIKRATLVVQSTQNLKTVKEIAAALRKQIKKLEFFNTVCVPTRLKQEEIRKMPLENQAMVIVGSKTSANTKRLYQISKKLNKNTHWVNSAKEINRQWFKGISSVGVTAGASTPRQATEKVLKYLKKIGRD